MALAKMFKSLRKPVWKMDFQSRMFVFGCTSCHFYRHSTATMTLSTEIWRRGFKNIGGNVGVSTSSSTAFRNQS